MSTPGLGAPAAPDALSQTRWTVSISASVPRSIGRSAGARHVARMFALAGGAMCRLYRDLELTISLGRILAIVGPSGGGKSLLLDRLARTLGPAVFWLNQGALLGESRRPIDLLTGPVCRRMELLGRCGLAEAAVMVTPARRLSGGQRYRLAMAVVLDRALDTGQPAVVLADEFGSALDPLTADILAGRMRRLIHASPVALVVATPDRRVLASLGPETIVVKPLDAPARVLTGASARRLACRGGCPEDPSGWRIRRTDIADYDALDRYHYRAGRPACHKRVYAIRPPKRWLRTHPLAPQVAGVIVVSPPLLGVRGRNHATANRYALQPRRVAIGRLNAEVECISRVVVHPVFRGTGLAVRLVRHVLRTSPAAVVEALAVMGHVHPFFALAGMTPWFGGGAQLDYVYYDHWNGRRPGRNPGMRSTRRRQRSTS